MFILRGSIILFLLFLSLFPVKADEPEGNLPRLKGIHIGNDSVLLFTRPIDREVILGERLMVHRDRNRITFEFTGTDSVSLRYRLEGFDENWSEFSHLPVKEYTNLPAGWYRLNVQSSAGGASDLFSVKFRILPWWYLSPTALLIYFMLLILLAWFLYQQLKYKFAQTQYMLEQLINTRTEDLIREKEKSETLLSNVLPRNTADEIMSKGKAAKIKYNFVTVLFSDIQGFTKIAEEMNPEVLIDELDKFFFHFDSVAEKYGIEKIKTIGDAYMCAGGIPEKNRTNPVEVILAALEMQKYMERLKAQSAIEGLKYWDIRIGIHTGTVVAGVVGHKKLTYDIWGDTVNTASRMESSGEAGKVNISGTTYEFVREFFKCEHRGKMPVKYKGELDMYFVEGIVDELRDEDGNPNLKFILRMQLLKLQDIEEYILKMYDEEAPPNLYFHNSQQIRSVCNQVDLLANSERLPDDDYIHLKLAAVFIDTGYMTDYDRPLEAACSLVDEILPRYGFSISDIEKTKGIITNSFKGDYKSNADKILHDARFDYLGRVDFSKLTEKLFHEETEYGKISDRKAWFRGQRKFVEEHEFITESAKLLRGIATEQQIDALNDLAGEVK